MEAISGSHFFSGINCGSLTPSYPLGGGSCVFSGGLILKAGGRDGDEMTKGKGAGEILGLFLTAEEQLLGDFNLDILDLYFVSGYFSEGIKITITISTP